MRSFLPFRPALLALVTALAPSLRAAEPSSLGGEPLGYYLPAGSSYDPAVPTPAQFFGFNLGAWHLRADQVEAYLRAVAAAAPDRVKIEVIGRTHEFKPLVVALITSPANHRDLERIRTQHLALFDPAKNAGLDVAKMPVVINMGYSIHGNEPSAVNAVPAVVYHFAAARGEKIDAQLRDAVIVLEALRNPDGSDRFAQWVNGNKGRVLVGDPQSRELNETWPRGRLNHYGFDPNRDWLPLTHPEARARNELFHRWRPSVLTDHHEMGTNSSFFFQPGVASRNNPLIPRLVLDLNARIAQFHANAFDARGVFYYAGQGFDDFYPGKGSTFPKVHGTIGILFEQGSSRGHLQESTNGPLTFPFTIRNQVITTFSTLEAALALRVELLTMQKNFTGEALDLARQSPVKAYVFGDDGDPARAWALLDLLRRHRIEVRALAAELTADGKKFLPGRAWVVPSEQPQHRFITEIFSRRTQFEDEVFYDVSAWNVLLGFGVPHATLTTVPALGDAVPASPAFPAGQLEGGHSDYAYLFSWTGYHAPRALLRLQQAGIMTKVLTAPIEAATAAGRTAFGYGSILVPVGLQPARAKEIAAIIDTITRDDAITVYGLATGYTPVGVDLGSSSFVTLKTPSVALVTGEGVTALDIGEAWHLLDTRVGLPATLLDVIQLRTASFTRYTAIVLADGLYERSIAGDTLENLKRWVRDGGTLIAMGRAAEWAAKHELARVDFGRESAAAPAATRAEAVVPAKRTAYADAENREALKLVSGAIFETKIDASHPLGFGYGGDPLPLFRDNALVMRPTRTPWETPVIYTEKPLLAGYASAANQGAIANSAAVVAIPSGAGVVVLMTDNPNFRGYWYGGNKLFLNALFFGQVIRPVRPRGGEDEAH
jgi:hypothetical protein